MMHKTKQADVIRSTTSLSNAVEVGSLVLMELSQSNTLTNQLDDTDITKAAMSSMLLTAIMDKLNQGEH